MCCTGCRCGRLSASTHWIRRCDVSTVEWGVEVTLVELKDIQLPDTMKRAMAKQAEAEREKRAKIINAEGESLAAAALGEASDIMMATLSPCSCARPAESVIAGRPDHLAQLESWMQSYRPEAIKRGWHAYRGPARPGAAALGKYGLPGLMCNGPRHGPARAGP